MANSVDLVIGSEAIKQVESLISKLSIADAELLKISQSAMTASKGISGISTPSGLDKAVSNTSALNAELERQNTIIKSLEIEIKKLAFAKQNNNKQSAQEVVNQRVLNQNAIAEAKATSNLIGSYQKLDLQHKRAIANAQNLAVQYGQTSNQFKRAASEANKLDKELKDIDSSLGKSQRNVGNYSSAFNSLGNSLGIVGGIAGAVSLGKEIFAVTAELQSLDNALKLVTATGQNYSEQQIFLSRISEAYGVEIGSLTKQFTQFYISAKDKLSGNQIQNIFESITKAGASMGLSVESQQRAFLALNQMMSKGTIQAEELRGQLGEALPGAFGIMAKSMGVTERQLGQLMKDGRVIASEVLPEFAKQLEKVYGIETLTRVENLTSAQSRLSNAWKDFVRSLDEDGNKMSKLFSFLLNQVTDTISGWRKLMTSSATTSKNELSRIRSESKKETIDFYDTVKNLDSKEIKAKKEKYENEARSIRKNFENLLNVNRQIEKTGVRSPFGQLTKEDADKIESNRKQMHILNQSMSVYYGNIEGLNEVLKPNAKIEQDIVKTKKEKVSVQKEERKIQIETEEWFNSEISRLETVRNRTADTTEEYKSYNVQLGILKNGLKALRGELSEFEGEGLKLNLEEMGLTADGFSEFQSKNKKSGKSSDHEKLKTDWKDTFNSIADSAQQAGDIIAEFSQRNFDNEYRRLEAQKDIALKFAGDSAEAKAKIEEDYEKKRKEIANRENKAKQKQAIFNIVIDTAQAVIQALPNIPLSIAIGVLGAAQLALVASQKIPQYFDGTDNHIGGLMLVNDGAGANFQEKVILPNGKEIIPEGRNVLMNAPKGTKVLTHEQQIMEMLNERGISMHANYNKNNGMTANEMDSVLGKHFAKIQTNNTTFDRNGFSSWIGSNGNKTIQNNNRVSRTGFKV